MTEKESGQADRRSILVAYWMEKAHESLAAGRSEYNSGRLSTAVRNLYYAAVAWHVREAFQGEARYGDTPSPRCTFIFLAVPSSIDYT